MVAAGEGTGCNSRAQTSSRTWCMLPRTSLQGSRGGRVRGSLNELARDAMKLSVLIVVMLIGMAMHDGT